MGRDLERLVARAQWRASRAINSLYAFKAEQGFGYSGIEDLDKALASLRDALADVERLRSEETDKMAREWANKRP
jgi:hypothetical protein